VLSAVYTLSISLISLKISFWIHTETTVIMKKRGDPHPLCISKNCIAFTIITVFTCGLILNFWMAVNSNLQVNDHQIDEVDEKSSKKDQLPILEIEPIAIKKSLSNGKTSEDINLLNVIKDNSIQQNNLRTKKKIIAYAITVTKDGPFIDGALVLGYSAKKVHDSSLGYHSKYDAELVAFVTPKVIAARPILKAYGWRVIERGLPVTLEEIKNPQYVKKMKDSGCCGADEFLKLWAYTLTEYHRVVHLDMDSIIYKNMDELYELDKEMLYTGDYNMQGGSPVPPAQGGFLVVRPSMDRFKEFQAIIRKGDHTGRGWGGSGIGNFWGGQTIQGIIPYFYYSLHKGDAQELNRCVYNCMVDNPYHPKKEGVCLDKKPTCEDCRQQKIENVASAHFTICQKPWNCNSHVNPRNSRLCTLLHNKWFELRDEFERQQQMDLSYRTGSDKPNTPEKFLGMCKGWGSNKYLPIPVDKLTIS